jgi:hypothetical protein
VPIPLDPEPSGGLGSGTQATTPVRPRKFLWAAGLVAAVTVFGALGYFAMAAVRPHLFAGRTKDEPKVEKVEVDARVIEHLPLYAVADDLAFVTELTKPELFGEDPAVSYDATLKVPSGDPGDKAAKHTEALTKAFRSLPQARRAEIVKLDQQLYALEPYARDRSFRALEAYAVWLERLPEAERRGVLSAETPNLRLDVIRKIRDQQWRDSLPASVRSDPASIQDWREKEAHRRDRLAFVRQHAEAFAANKSPWPFDTEAGRKDVVEFARGAFKIDDPKRCRLAPDELAEYRRTLDIAQRDGAWAWYGLLVYEMSKVHPPLPESDNPKLMITEPAELPSEVTLRLAGKKSVLPARLRALSGKWPEFPLEAHREFVSLSKFGQVPALGPARLADYKEQVRTFANKELFPHLTGEEKTALQRLEGRWPEHPFRFILYAHKYDLSVPGVTLPGSPKKWDATYGARLPHKPTN